MKKLFVSVPVIFLALFLLMSFVLKEKGVAKVIRNKSGLANIVFKSTDGGQTWRDISNGLPENLREGGIKGNKIFANDKGLFLRVGNGLYHNTPDATAPFWTKEILSDTHSSIANNKPGAYAYNYWGVNLKETDGTSVWSPIFELSYQPRIRNVFETAGGTILLATDKGIFKTTNSGKTWKHVYGGDLVGNLAESKGVLVAPSAGKIIRSTDNGENWVEVTSDGDVTHDIKQINGGFTTLTSSSASTTRTLKTSSDGGKTWQPIGTGLRDKAIADSIWRTWNDRPRVQAVMTSIIQVGENFFCSHPDGIFKSSDKGKTWKLLLPSIDKKTFSLFVSGNVIYAIPSKGGC